MVVDGGHIWVRFGLRMNQRNHRWKRGELPVRVVPRT